MKIENGKIAYLQDKKSQSKQEERGEQGEPPTGAKDRQDSSMPPPTKKEKSYKKETTKQDPQINHTQTEEKSLEAPTYFSETNNVTTGEKQTDLPLVFALGIRVLFAFSLILGIVYLSIKRIKKRKTKMEARDKKASEGN